MHKLSKFLFAISSVFLVIIWPASASTVNRDSLPLHLLVKSLIYEGTSPGRGYPNLGVMIISFEGRVEIYKDAKSNIMMTQDGHPQIKFDVNCLDSSRSNPPALPPTGYSPPEDCRAFKNASKLEIWATPQENGYPFSVAYVQIK